MTKKTLILKMSIDVTAMDHPTIEAAKAYLGAMLAGAKEQGVGIAFEVVEEKPQEDNITSVAAKLIQRVREEFKVNDEGKQ